MKNAYYTLILLFGIFLIVACDQTKSTGENEPDIPEEMDQEALVEYGNYLVTAIGCDDCHTPKNMTEQGPVPDMDKRFMGHPASMTLPEIGSEMYTGQWVYMTPTLTAAVGPWGTSYAANLTSDETGIGGWTFDNFKNAMTKGMYKGMEGTRPIMPPMPWQSFAHFKDEELKAMFAYLQTTKPIANVVPAYQPPPAE